ncbi:formylglycine-generating enzyme family protein [Pseudaestuariivita atlantica]|uniref:Sulfatase modifying factor 1 (C-alpha-formyglycine-generating enzyme 1) n=1 Tax=Pseudaestuariivita atlantica TaxID=1317121 RepID=A0A0L1JRA8_9RHOB|nr:formylglycine-generating enzyme family protein [Pseudaestuariivita atlantica]KNG94329.1 sulfatase modifying factor 1 (C-alpha-formyglycine- generating enzyme 1) [Pseudaestuariivita atlantica]
MGSPPHSAEAGCCAPARDGGARPGATPVAEAGSYPDAIVDIPGGAGLIGTSAPHLHEDGEGPLRKTRIRPFRMGATVVTNAAFARFVAATGFVTETERWGWSFVFHADVPPGTGPTDAVPEAPWWRRVDGACWSAPNGPGTEDACHPDHPVTQLSWEDARAYAAWVGGRLPSEAEWEHAARGGLGDVRFPWGGDEPRDDGPFPCNIWQGTFPDRNTAADGYATTAPASAFAPNGYGLYQMCGNVWEWTADAWRVKSLKKAARARAAAMRGYKVSKGGSYLCHASYCYRYRIAARSGNSPDSATPHHGLRVVWDV